MLVRGFKAWCENVALLQRKGLGLGPVDPLDPRRLAEHLGIAVTSAEEVPGADPACLKVLLEDDADSWSAITISVNARDLVILNPTHSPARKASDLMHELAHMLAGHEPARVDITEDGLLVLNSYDRRQEEEANWLAGCLLLPREALLQIKRKQLSVAVATKTYGVSRDMLEYRLNVSGVNYQLGRSTGHRR